MLRGLSAFPITPADANGRVDVPALRRVLARLAPGGADSVGLLGSTGTYAYLTRAERRRAIDAAMEELGTRIPVLVGVGALRTDEAVRLAQDARDAGATAGLLAPVSYTPLTEDEVYEHFVTVARESGLPLCIYDNPSTTHFSFTPMLVERLAAGDGIVALKSGAPAPDAVAAHLGTLRAAVPAGFSVGYAADWNVTEALIAGADAWYSVAGGLFPEPCAAIVRAIRAGDAAGARRLNGSLEPLWSLFREFSSLRVVYAAAGILGLGHAEPPRPILPLGEKARGRIETVLRELDLA